MNDEIDERIEELSAKMTEVQCKRDRLQEEYIELYGQWYTLWSKREGEKSWT